MVVVVALHHQAPLPALSPPHSLPIFSWHLNFIQYPHPPTTTTNLVSLSLPLIMTHCAEETPCDSASTGSRGQGHPVPGFHS